MVPRYPSANPADIRWRSDFGLSSAGKLAHLITHLSAACVIHGFDEKTWQTVAGLNRSARDSKVQGVWHQGEARNRAAREEYLILNGAQIASTSLFGDVLDRYAREVSIGKRGAK